MADFNVHELPCRPDTDVMTEFIQRLFSGAGMRGLVEIAWTSPKAPHRLERAKLYDLGDLDIAVDEAAQVNENPNCNIYLSAGLRRTDAPRHGRGEDKDVQACVAVWADFDAPGAMEGALKKVAGLGLVPNIVTYTGLKPHTRGQMWWLLEEPNEDLELHASLCRRIALALGGDTKVFNPSRVMRFIGSVAWPMKQGRSLEMTGIHGGAAMRPEAYTLEELQRKIEALKVKEPRDAQAKLYDFSTAQPIYDLDDLVSQAQVPGQWHNAALAATAHLLGRGTPPAVVVDMLVPLLTQPGFTRIQTYNELLVMVRGALQKGIYREQQQIGDGDLGGAGAAKAGDVVSGSAASPASPFITVDQLFDLPPVEWMVDKYLPMNGMSALFAPPGAFKSFLALDLALSVAYGVDWHGLKVRQRNVLYIVAEGRHGFAGRIRAWQEARVGGAGIGTEFMLLPQPVNFLEHANVDKLVDAIDQHLGGVGFVVIDTLARNFGTGDENSTKDMNAYVAGVDKLVSRGAHVMNVHHTGKDGSKGERGSSAFRGALDTALYVDREPGADVGVLHVKKQKDGEEARPMRLGFPIVEAVHPKTGEVLKSRVATCLGESTVPVTASPKAGTRMSKDQQRLLELVRQGIGSLAILTAQAGADRSNVRRALIALEKRGLLYRDENHLWRAIPSEGDHTPDHTPDHRKAVGDQYDAED